MRNYLKKVELSSSEEVNYVEAFWAAYKKRKHAANYGAKSEALIDWDEDLSILAHNAIVNNQINETDKYFNFLNGYKNGSVLTNQFGKKLYFKRG